MPGDASSESKREDESESMMSFNFVAFQPTRIRPLKNKHLKRNNIWAHSELTSVRHRFYDSNPVRFDILVDTLG